MTKSSEKFFLRTMSFRSRSRPSQPVVRRRSLSNSRAPTSSSSNNPYLSSSSYNSSRPLSSAYPSYTSSYGNSNQYGSRESLYNSSNRNGYYNNPSTSSYNSSNSSYKSPYGDRYVSPYASYDNGITTAGLSLSAYTPGSTYKNNYANGGNYSKKDYSSLRNGNLSNRYSTSNSSLNNYGLSTPSSTASSRVNRSQSFKDYDRKSRVNRNKTNASTNTSTDNSRPSKTARSYSISSEKSEGYEVRHSSCVLL